EPLRLSADDLYSPRVEAFLDEQAMMSRAMPEADPQPWILRVLYSSYFYLSLASGLGAFVAWMMIEPFISEARRETLIFGLLLSPSVAGCPGLFLGAAEGVMCRNPQRALICGSVGLAIGFLGGLVAIFPAGFLFLIMQGVAFNLSKNPQPDAMPTGLAL